MHASAARWLWRRVRSELTCGEGDGGGERECRLRLLVWLVKADPLVGYLRSVPICAPVSRHRWSGLEFFGRCAALPCFVVLLAHRRVGASNSIRWPITIFSYFFLEEIDWSRQLEEKGVRWPLAKEKIVKSIKVLPNLEFLAVLVDMLLHSDPRCVICQRFNGVVWHQKQQNPKVGATLCRMQMRPNE